jgi:hypothetical protein
LTSIAPPIPLIPSVCNKRDAAGRSSETSLAAIEQGSSQSKQTMRVEFDATIKDVVDVAMKSMTASRPTSVQGWIEYIFNSAIAAAFSAMFMYFLCALSNELLQVRLILCTIAGVASALAWPYFFRSATKESLRRRYREMLGSKAPFRVVVEISAKGVLFTQLSAQHLYEWDAIEEIAESPEGIFFRTRFHGIAAVRNRAFATAEMKTEFVEQARRYLTASGARRDV